MWLQSYFKASCFEEEVLIIPGDVTELQTPWARSTNCLLMCCPKELHPGEFHNPVEKYRLERLGRSQWPPGPHDWKLHNLVGPATWETQG